MSQWVESALPESDPGEHKWMSASTHWNCCQTVLRKHIWSLYTLHRIRFWFLLSDSVNGSWRRCGNWVSERESNFSRATQPVRGKARFQVQSVSSRAGSSHAGHSKGMSTFLSVYVLWQSQLPQQHTRRSHSSGLLLSSSPLGSVLSLCPGCPTPWSPFLPSLQLLNPPLPTTLLRSLLLLSGGHSSMLPLQWDHVFQLVALPKLSCHHCPIQTEGSGSFSSHKNSLYYFLLLFFPFFWWEKLTFNTA